MQSPRIKLSIGPSGPVRTVTTVVALAFIGFSLVFMAVAFGLGTAVESMFVFDDEPFAHDPFFGEQPPTFDRIEETSSLFGLVYKLMGLCGVPFVLAGVYGLLYVWRYGAWLDGTVLRKRGALLTRGADLTTADVSMGGVNYQHGTQHYRTVVRVPALAVTDAGRTIKLPLRGQGLDLLPASQLRALADALERNRSGESARARAIGAHLRSLADDPLAH